MELNSENETRKCNNFTWLYHTGPPLKLLLQDDFTSMGWDKALKVEFNKNGSMLLISGALKKDIMGRTKGEILVLSVREKFKICAKITNRPSEAMGCWYNNKYLVSSEFKCLALGVSISMLWMNKVSADISFIHSLCELVILTTSPPCFRSYRWSNPSLVMKRRLA